MRAVLRLLLTSDAAGPEGGDPGGRRRDRPALVDADEAAPARLLPLPLRRRGHPRRRRRRLPRLHAPRSGGVRRRGAARRGA